MKSYLKTKDYAVTGEEFELLYDESLKMLVTEPQPKKLNKYYKSKDYISHTDASKTIIDKIYQIVKKNIALGRKSGLFKNIVLTVKHSWMWALALEISY